MRFRKIATMLAATTAVTATMALASPAAHAACTPTLPGPGQDPSVGVCYGIQTAYNPVPTSTGVNGVCFVVEVYFILGGGTEQTTTKGGTGAVELSGGQLYHPCPTQII